MKHFFQHIALLIMLALSLQAFSQHSDCETMLPLNDTIYEATNITGFGEKLEYTKNKLSDSLNFEEEKNSIWYLITAPTSGTFSFDIKTNAKANDWDFLLYEYSEQFCQHFTEKKIVPIRSNLSRSAVTGLSSEYNKSFVGAGINSNYSKTIEATAKQQYVLVVNNAKQSGGSHTLILHFAKPTPTLVKENEQAKPKDNQLDFTLSIKDANTKQPLVGNILIEGLLAKPIEKEKVTTYQINVPQRKYKLNVNANAKGYLLQSNEIKIKAEQHKLEIEILLEPIKKGKKINLKNIQFHGNVAKFLPQATTDLLSLLNFMQLNPEVHIEIEGHVNGPGQRNSKEYQQLSEDRAAAVKAYLTENGISENRLKSIGYGNTKMVFPTPKSEKEMSENRRVEIKIVQL